MASEKLYRPSITRELLAAGTKTWGEQGLSGHEAYLEFVKQLGSKAASYDTYFSCAITNGGYARDTSKSFGERVEANTDYCLLIADELERSGKVQLDDCVDAVALGKVNGWEQTDYLAFFLNVMARPVVTDVKAFDTDNKSLLKAGEDFDPSIFNDSKLNHDQRRPHYQALGRRYVAMARKYPLRPIDRMIEILDWNMTLGGLVERETAHELDAAVYRPAVSIHGNFAALMDVNPELRAHAETLTSLGADVVVKKHPSLELVQVPHQQ